MLYSFQKALLKSDVKNTSTPEEKNSSESSVPDQTKPKQKVKSKRISKHTAPKQKADIEDCASIAIPQNEITTKDDLEIDNGIAYLPNDYKPFTWQIYKVPR